MSEIVIVQRKSAIGEKEGARRTLATLGLRHPGARASHEDSPSLRGKLRLVAHLVEIQGDPSEERVARRAGELKQEKPR